MKNKKLLIIIIFSICFIIGVYIGYKYISLYKYNPSELKEIDYEKDVVSKLEYKSEIKLTHQDLEETEEYLTFENIKIRNDFKDYEELDINDNDEIKSYQLIKKIDGEVYSAFFIGKDKSVVNILKQSNDFFGTTDNLDNKYYKELFEKYNINTDLELLEFIKSNKDIKVNIFTPIKVLKERYAKMTIFLIMFPNFDSIDRISGNYQGYMFEAPSGIKEASIEINGDKYYFTFISKKDVFSNEYINELLNTLIIE